MIEIWGIIVLIALCVSAVRANEIKQGQEEIENNLRAITRLLREEAEREKAASQAAEEFSPLVPPRRRD